MPTSADKEVLAREVPLVRAEMERLRADIGALAATMVPRKEQERVRRTWLLAAAAIVIVGVVFGTLQHRQDNQIRKVVDAVAAQQQDAQQAGYDSCLKRNLEAKQNAVGGGALFTLLDDLAAAEAQDPTTAGKMRAAAYAKYERTIQSLISRQDPAVKPVDCRELLPKEKAG